MDNGDAFLAENEAGRVYEQDVQKEAVEAINEIIELKKAGYPIGNGFNQLEAFKIMISNPEQIQNTECRVGENNFAIDPYGNCRICFCMEPIGNLKDSLPENLWFSETANEIREKISKCTKKCRLLN